MKGLLKIIGTCLLILIFMLWGLFTLDSVFKAGQEYTKNIEFSYYEDTTGQLNISEINTVYLKGNFIEKESPNFNFSRSHSAFWIRIFAENRTALKKYLAFYCPNIQNVQLYIPTEEGYKTYASGWGNSTIREDEDLTYPVFRLNQESRANQAIYLRVQSDYSHIYTIGFYNEKELNRARAIDYCLNSFLFGILLTIVMINLVNYFVMKSRICLLFSLCVFLISVHQGCTTGIYNVILGAHSDVIMGFSIEIGILYLISNIAFFMVLSEVKTYNRFFYLCSKVLIVACLMCYPICFVDKVAANFYGHILSVVPPLFIFYATLHLYFTGKMRYFLFLVGWNITIITYVLVTLCGEGILHLQNNYIGIHGVLIGIVISSILFTVATVIHVKTIQVEHLKMKQQVQLVTERVKQTETALLQTQIKPHFLYNTLTSIEQMCEIDSRKAQKAIENFANYLRSNIDFSVETKSILMEKEMSNVKHYLSLEQMRFEDRLHVIYDIQASDFMVPPLVVQPIVENAVRHGVTKKSEGGTVKIAVRKTKTEYLIIVTDNGIGFNPDSDTWKKGHHIGIDNARERLNRQCYGTLEIDSQIGIGTTVTIMIPRGRNYESDCS